MGTTFRAESVFDILEGQFHAKVCKTKATKPFDSFGGTNGSNTDFVERDTATGARMDGGSDGPLLLPDGSPAYDSSGRLRSMF